MTATVQIQSVGRCKGKAAGQLQVGDVTIWNFGYTHAFVGFAKETKAQVIAQFANKDGSVTMSELAEYVKSRVATLTNNKQSLTSLLA